MSSLDFSSLNEDELEDLELMEELATESYQKGKLAILKGKYRTAEHYFKEGLELDDTLPILFEGQGAALLGMERFPEALQAAESGLNLDSESEQGLLIRAHALMGLVRLDEAKRAYMHLADLYPGNEAAHDGIEHALAALEYSEDDIVVETESPHRARHISAAMATSLSSISRSLSRDNLGLHARGSSETTSQGSEASGDGVKRARRVQSFDRTDAARTAYPAGVQRSQTELNISPQRAPSFGDAEVALAELASKRQASQDRPHTPMYLDPSGKPRILPLGSSVPSGEMGVVEDRFGRLVLHRMDSMDSVTIEKHSVTAGELLERERSKLAT